jgi:hypothetical protein
LLEVCSGQQTADRNADIATDLGGDFAVVAGDDFDGDAEVVQSLDCCTGVRLRSVEERQESGKGEIAFVARERRRC